MLSMTCWTDTTFVETITHGWHSVEQGPETIALL